MNTTASSFVAKLVRKISAMSGNDRESSYLFQWISVLIEHYNAVVLNQGFSEENHIFHINININFFFPSGTPTEGQNSKQVSK